MTRPPRRHALGTCVTLSTTITRIFVTVCQFSCSEVPTSYQRSPAAPLSSSCSSAASSHSVRRRHIATATERRFAVVLIAGRLGTDLHRLYKGPGAQSSPRATSYDPPSVALASSRAREGLLPRVRPVRSPPSPGRFHRHQCLSLSTLSTKNSPSLSRAQPHAQFWPETTAAPNSLSTRMHSPPRSSSPATPSTSATMAGTHGFVSTP